MTGRALVSYNMNILRGELPAPFCVSLNPRGRVDESKVLRRFVYHHPVFNQGSIAAQQRRADLWPSAHPLLRGLLVQRFSRGRVRSALDVAQTLRGRAMRAPRPDATGRGDGGGSAPSGKARCAIAASPQSPRLSYSLFMLGLDLDELPRA